MRPLARLSLVLALLAAAPWAQAAGYPDRPVKLVVNFAAGGPLDTVARLIAEQAAQRLKQPVIVENRAGAAGNIGAEYVARAPKDGYTALVSIDHLLTVNPLVYKDMGLDPFRDLVPAGIFGTTSQMLVAHPSLGVKNFRDFLTRAAKEDLTYASAGLASPGHLTFELLKAKTGIRGTHIPYKGNAPALADVVAGHVPLAFVASSNTLAYARSGALQALASSSAERNPQLPQVPTVQEQGVPDFDVQFSQVILFPSGTPAAVIETWEKLLRGILNSPEVRRQLDVMAVAPYWADAAQTTAWLRATRERWKALIERLNMQIN
ncbi:ABC transporter substrate-binding protein [Pigmentiphaga sp. NML080357]|uniref:Bug family tripartite tricarboxylate transporter substrate binding protein n=1 Tax=Pigmentiphaga sp. NML080357 TaxID=2008675 RepID=UPI000B41C2C7|nr:tripartite tricarboxylate transporter substrate binding protein [Pigmentiphaga sp. NML080357]OVZ59446.1 ABC transporter substrate-binding protein [Pigmentiphaga sp. NML080357]